MTAFHTIILFSDGAPLTPAGGSSCSLILEELHIAVNTTKNTVLLPFYVLQVRKLMLKMGVKLVMYK